MIERWAAVLVTATIAGFLSVGLSAGLTGCGGQPPPAGGSGQDAAPSPAAGSHAPGSGGSLSPAQSPSGGAPDAAAEQPDRVRASQIRFGFQGSRGFTGATTREQALAKAEQTLAELQAGADLAGLAHERSDDPSRAHGGDLGPFARDEIHPKLAAAAFKLKVGEISGIIETEWGFHILRRTK